MELREMAINKLLSIGYGSVVCFNDIINVFKSLLNEEEHILLDELGALNDMGSVVIGSKLYNDNIQLMLDSLPENDDIEISYYLIDILNDLMTIFILNLEEYSSNGRENEILKSLAC